ncbi:MAG: RES family NAD+ phosphorylase [Parvularculaceae bacterium]
MSWRPSFTSVRGFRGGFMTGVSAYYAANRFETAVAETTYHRARIYSNERPGWFSQFRELVGSIDARVHDIRGRGEFEACLAPESYAASQALARELRAEGSNGIVYPSVRDPEGQCVAAFWPDVVSIPVLGRALAYHFDGEQIDYIRDETSKEVWRIG